jgi:hypothetical protein
MEKLAIGARLKTSRRSFLTGLTGLYLIPQPKSQERSPLPDAPPPKFWFGDRVTWRWWVEDPNDRDFEIEVVETGTVIGLARGQNQYYWDKVYKSWWYWVKRDSTPDETLSEQMVVEKELELKGNGSC